MSRPPDAPRKGDYVHLDGEDYEVIANLMTNSAVEPGVVHVHLVLKQLVSIEVMV